MDEQVRTFIALELGDAQRRALGRLQTKLRDDKGARFVRWVAPDGMHLTLKFLGEMEAGQIAAVERTVANVCAGTGPFTLKLSGLGAFPNTRRPNVVWVGLEGDVDSAARLAQQIDVACAALGFARETRPFAPHLTLGRVKRDVRPAEQQAVGEMLANAAVGELGEFQARRVCVMKSDLRPSGSIYTELYGVEL